MADAVPDWAQDDTPDWAKEPQGNPQNWSPVQSFTNAILLGMGPSITGWIGNHLPGGGATETPDQINADRAAFEQAHPYQAGVANAVGGSLPYLAAGEVAAPLGLAGRAAAMAGTGAGTGALSSYAEDQDPAVGAVGGALAGAGGELGGSALAGVGGKLADALLNRGVVTPSSAGLKNISRGQYTALTNNPTIVPMSETGPFVDDVLNQFNTKLLDETSANRQFQKIATGSAPANTANQSTLGIPLGKLEQIRQNLTDIQRSSPGTPDAAAATLGKQRIDTFLSNRAATDPATQQFLRDAQAARGNWRAAKVSDIVTNNIDRATGQASTNLADNSNQLISKRANAILQQPKLSGGMSPDELSAVKKLRSGSPVRNFAQSLGAATGHTGIGLAVAVPELLMQVMEHGFDPHVILPTAAAMAGGIGAHKLANSLAESEGRGVASLVRRNSPAFQASVASGASSAPIDVGPAQIAARKLSAALGAAQFQHMKQDQQ